MRFESIPLALLERCRGECNGSGAISHACEELCELLQPDLYAFLFSLLRDHDDAEEAMVECMVRVCRHLSKLQSAEKFPGWIMRMAVNQAQTVRSRGANRTTLPLEDGMEIRNDQLVGSGQNPPSPRASAEGREIRAFIDSAMTELPLRQRSAVILYEIEQLSVREIAESMECSEGAVKFHLHEARKKLRTLLAPLLDGVTDRTGGQVVS